MKQTQQRRLLRMLHYRHTCLYNAGTLDVRCSFVSHVVMRDIVSESFCLLSYVTYIIVYSRWASTFCFSCCDERYDRAAAYAHNNNVRILPYLHPPTKNIRYKSDLDPYVFHPYSLLTECELVF